MSDSSPNRYARQIRFPPIGETGQAELSKSSVAVVGCGALGTVAAEILTRAGIGRLRLIDRDVVEWTNLQRQSLFVESDAVAGNAKADAATKRLQQINSDIDIEPWVTDLHAANIQSSLSECDLVIDATDNFQIRFLINDWSLENKTPWVHGGCVGASGQVRLFDGTGSPCFRCLVPMPPPADSVQTCDTAGVVGSATHLIASLQATEAIKWLSGNHDAVRTSVISLDLWNNRIRELNLSPSLSKDCPACGQGKRDFLDGTLGAADAGATVLCGRNAVQLSATGDSPLPLAKIADQWESLGEVQETPFFVRIKTAEATNEAGQAIVLTLFRDGRVVVDGTEDPSVARTLRDRFVGG